MKTAVVLLVLVGAILVESGDRTTKPGPWKACRTTVCSAMDTIKAVLKGMEDDQEKKEMYVCDPGCEPCEQVILRNLRSLAVGKQDPCSRQTFEGNDGCYDQFIPLELTDFSAKCCFSNEITFLLGLLKFLGKTGADQLCKLPGFNVLPPCVGKAVTGLTDKLKLGKRNAAKPEVACKDRKKSFCLVVTSKKSNVDLNMTNDWDKDLTNVTACSFKQESLGGLTLTIEGKGATLLGHVLELLTKQVKLLGMVLGLLLELPMKIILPNTIKGNQAVKDNIGAMNCGD